MRILPLCLALWATTGPATAQPTLDLPIDCTPGDTCYVQNYVDRDPGPGAHDYACGALSYNGHKGTDFGLPSLAAMQSGVTVRAAADGKVRGTRDGMIDRVYSTQEDNRINGRDCGNGVVIDHGNGWETQYCHLRQGTVAVKSGQQVSAGTPLGLVGLSGRTQFPHLHISVRHNGEVIDPFTPTAATATCGTAPEPTLWADDLGYQPGALLSLGFATKVPDYADIKAGTATETDIGTDAPALVLWGFAFGGQTDDIMEFAITGPRGRVYQGRQTLKKNQALFFRAGGKRLRAPLPPGDYKGTVTLIRKGESVSKKSTTILIK
jgi:hypothetical protein